MRLLSLLFILLLIQSCVFDSDKVNLKKGFDYGFIHEKKHANISYQNAGLTASTVTKVWCNDMAIVSEVNDTSYTIIDVEKYLRDPRQELSGAIYSGFSWDEVEEAVRLLLQSGGDYYAIDVFD